MRRLRACEGSLNSDELHTFVKNGRLGLEKLLVRPEEKMWV